MASFIVWSTLVVRGVSSAKLAKEISLTIWLRTLPFFILSHNLRHVKRAILGIDSGVTLDLDGIARISCAELTNSFGEVTGETEKVSVSRADSLLSKSHAVAFFCFSVLGGVFFTCAVVGGFSYLFRPYRVKLCCGL